MCEITNVRELVESIDRFRKIRDEMEENHPKLARQLKPVLDELGIFMSSSRMYLDNLFTYTLNNKDKIKNLEEGEIVLNFKREKRE